MKRARIDKIDEKTYRVMLGDHEIGTSKTSFDAQFHVNAINDALDVAHLEGEKYLERMVKEQRIKLEVMKETLKVEADWYKTYGSQMFVRDEEPEEKTPPSKSDGGASFI